MSNPVVDRRKRAFFKRLLVSSSQRVLFSLELFSRHEMANHAAAGFGALLGLTINVERYGVVYGILGNLIVGLIKVYFFFWLYFFFLEFCYTLEFFDSLLFARFHRVLAPDIRSGKVERALFGEMAGLLDEPRSAWAVALTDCTVFVLPPVMFKRFLEHDPAASTRFIELLASRLKANNEYITGAYKP